MRKFLLLIEGSGVSKLKPFYSIKLLNQFISRNKVKGLSFTRYVWLIDHWERFLVFEGVIITHSDAIAIATMLANKTTIVKAMTEGSLEQCKAN